MSRLIVSSPPLIGTSGSDLVVGKEDNTLLPAIPAIGIEVLKNGVIDTQAGNDTISGTGTGGYELRNYGPPAIGISNTHGYINGGDGNDLIKGTAAGGGSGKIDIPIGINNTQHSRIDGGFGNDTIFGTGVGGGQGDVIGISNTQDSLIDGGKGNNTIFGTSVDNNWGLNATGIFNSGGSHIKGGEGNNSITGIGKGGNGIVSPFSTNLSAGNGIGISNSQGSVISGGQGNDILSGTGTGGEDSYIPSYPEYGTVPPGVGIGIVNSGMISLGDGNDTIIGTGISPSTGIVNTNGIICEGAGSDILTGYGTSVGIQGGTIDGGNGNDYFKARRIDDKGNPVSKQGGAIADVLIKGGGGNDTFDVGYGNATIDGGSGWDKLILPDFKSDYIIAGTSNNYTVKRDQFTLNVLNVEQITFLGVPPQQNVLGIPH